jgi:hypothetical protein
MIVVGTCAGWSPLLTVGPHPVSSATALSATRSLFIVIPPAEQ